MAYQMRVGAEITSVYCHLSTAGLGTCGVGGWTLVMKINGTQVLTQKTFHVLSVGRGGHHCIGFRSLYGNERKGD